MYQVFVPYVSIQNGTYRIENEWRYNMTKPTKEKPTRYTWGLAEKGEYDSKWSYIIYCLTYDNGIRKYCVQIHSHGTTNVTVAPAETLYRTRHAARAAIPSHVEQAELAQRKQ